MITKNNYFKEVKNIDYEALPQALKEGYDTIKFGSKDYTTWEYLNDDKEFLDVYFKKLNEFQKRCKPQKQKAARPAPKKKVKPDSKKENYKGQKVEIRPAPGRSKKFIVWDVKSNQKFANEKFDSIKIAESFIRENKMTIVKTELPEPVQVERTSDEVRFIKRYILLDGKVKTKHQILLFINAMQKAITEKRIRKTSKHASEIIDIQDKLVELYNKMPEQIKVDIDAKTLEKYKNIAGSEKPMLSITYIKRFISLHGKTGVKEKAKRLLSQMNKAVKSGKLDKHDPYKDRLESVYTALGEYLKGKTKAPEITTAELSGLMGILENNSLFSKKKSASNSNLEGITGVISSVQLSEMQFNTIGLQGKYQELIGDPSIGFSCMVYGKPKSGKSTMCIDFARHLAENHGKVLYAAIEEGYGYTMQEKLERLNAVHPNLFVSEDIPQDLSAFEFVFIDSVSKGKIDNEKLNELIKANPKTAFIFIFHSTKEGDFRGGQENAHDVDCIIEVKDGVAKGKGRFGVGGEMCIFCK